MKIGEAEGWVLPTHGVTLGESCTGTTGCRNKTPYIIIGADLEHAGAGASFWRAHAPHAPAGSKLQHVSVNRERGAT